MADELDFSSVAEPLEPSNSSSDLDFSSQAEPVGEAVVKPRAKPGVLTRKVEDNQPTPAVTSPLLTRPAADATRGRGQNVPDAGHFGFGVRTKLFPGEDDYFKKNPTVAGMASESNDIILNPYADKSINRDAVAKNEAFRLKLRKDKITPDFAITDEQRKAFKGTPYEKDDAALKSTIAARVYSGDPSAKATPEQKAWVENTVKDLQVSDAEDQPDPTKGSDILGEFGRATKRTIGAQNIELAGHTALALQEAFGNEDPDIKKAAQGMIDTGREMGNDIPPPHVGRWHDIHLTQPGALGRLGEYIAQAAGQGVGSTALPIFGGIVGGATGDIMLSKPGAVVGGLAGTFGGSASLNIGSMRQTLLKEGLTGTSRADHDGTATPEETRKRKADAALLRGKVSIAAGLAMSALDTVLPARVLSQLTGAARKELEKSIIKRVLKSIGKSAAIEGSTEGTQQAIQDISGKDATGKPIEWGKLADDVVENILQGGIGGALFGLAEVGSHGEKAADNTQPGAPGAPPPGAPPPAAPPGGSGAAPAGAATGGPTGGTTPPPGGGSGGTPLSPEHDVLTQAGYHPDDIADMNPVERDTAVKAAVAAGYKPKPAIEPGLQEAIDIDAARATVNTDPTHGQSVAGNYQKGHIKLHGLDISIENPKGSVRQSKDPANKWSSPPLPADYGYIRGTIGKDKDHLDVYIGPDPTNDRVFVIDQNNIETGVFDEHKTIIGANSAKEAVKIYEDSFPDGKGRQRIRSISQMTIDEFKDWTKTGDTKKPFSSTPLSATKSEKPADVSTGQTPLPVVRPTSPEFIAASKAEREAKKAYQDARTEQEDIEAAGGVYDEEKVAALRKAYKEAEQNSTAIAIKEANAAKADNTTITPSVKEPFVATDDQMAAYSSLVGSKEAITVDALAAKVGGDKTVASRLLAQGVNKRHIIQTKGGRYIRSPKRVKPVSFTEWIASVGGMKDDGGELKSRDLHGKNTMTPYGPWARATGKSPAQILELAIQEGYIKDASRVTGAASDVTEAEVYKLIDQEVGGRKAYKAEDQAKADEIDAQHKNEMADPDAVPRLHDQLSFLDKNYGPDIRKELADALREMAVDVSRGEIDAAAKSMLEGMSAENAIEAAIIRAKENLLEEGRQDPDIRRLLNAEDQETIAAWEVAMAFANLKNDIPSAKDSEDAKPGSTPESGGRPDNAGTESEPGDETKVPETGGETPRPGPAGEEKPEQVEPPKGEKPKVEKPKAEETPTPKPEVKPDVKIEDAGEKIGGARKDAWRERGLEVKDLKDMTDAEKAAYTTKENVWHRPDYAQLVTDGMEPTAAYYLKLIYDRIPVAPRKPKQITEYIAAIHLVRQAAEGAKTIADMRDMSGRVETVFKNTSAQLEGLGESMSSASSVLYYLSKDGRGRYGSTIHFDLTIDYSERARAERAVKDGFPHQEPWTKFFGISKHQTEGKPTYWWVYAKANRKFDTKNNFDTEEAAKAAAKAAYENRSKDDEGGDKLPDRPHLDSIERVGPDYRQGRNVTSEDFISDFGFRGVEFGNWVASDERQRIVNLGYDAFQDLAWALGVPPKALSLNGTLGIGFGSRGRGGKAAAHYESHKLVINMTKLTGAGSLAHEWGHAFDHYLGEQDGGDKYGGAARSISGWRSVNLTPALNGLPPKLRNAARNLMQALYHRGETNQEMQARLTKALADAENGLIGWEGYRDKAAVQMQTDPARKRHWASERAKAIRHVEQWTNIVDRRRDALASPKEHHRLKTGETDFYKQAKKLSGTGDYWIRGNEMLARSFEAFVFDALKAKERKSEYLVHGVEGSRYGAGYRANPYPNGDERAQINAAYERLLDTLHVVEGKAGMGSRIEGAPGVDETVNTETSALAPITFEPIPLDTPLDDGPVPAGERDTETPTPNAPEANKPASDATVEAFRGFFRDPANSFETIVQARKFAEEHGFTAEAGSLDAKELEEKIEWSLVLAARDIIADSASKDPGVIYDLLVDLYRRQPRLAVRTTKSMADQAYSTPVPLAYLAQNLAHIGADTTVYEPTAGNGALIFTATPSNVFANEIGGTRARHLSEQGYRVASEDATGQQGQRLAGSDPKDVVIANPPFGTVQNDKGETKTFTVDGWRTTSIDHAIALQALKAMKKDGKAVLIVGSVKEGGDAKARFDAYNRTAKREFYWRLYNGYNVTDHFTVSGDLYAKQGAGWPVDVIVIDGKGKSKRGLPAVDLPTTLTSWAEVKEKIDGASGSGTVRNQSGERPGQTPEPGGRLEGNGDGTGTASGGEQPAAAGSDATPEEQPAGVRAPSDLGAGLHLGEQPAAPAIQEPVGSGGGSESGRLGEPPSDLDLGNAFDNILNEFFPDEKAGPEEPAPAKAAAPEQKPAAPEKTNPFIPKGTSGRLTKYGRATSTWTPSPPQPALDEIDLPDETKAPDGKPNRGPRTPRPPRARDKAKDALKNTAMGLDEIASGLFALFNDPNKLNIGFTFDEETYKKAKPMFEAAFAHFKEAAKDAVTAMRLLIKSLIEKFNFTNETLNRMKPYIMRYIEETVPKKDLPPPGPTPKGEEIETEAQKKYVPRSKMNPSGTLVPANMETAITEALAAIEKKHGNIDTWVGKELGYTQDEMRDALQAEQVDAIAMALEAVKNKSAFIIGDQTGIGKGRVVASMLRYALRNGLTPIFVTHKPNLYGDIIRDLNDIKVPAMLGRDIGYFMTNMNEEVPIDAEAVAWFGETEVAKAEGAKPPPRRGVFLKSASGEKHKAQLRQVAADGGAGPNKTYDIILTTYNQMQTQKGEEPERRSVIRQIAAGSFLVMDESHNAGGQGEDGRGPKLNKDGTPKAADVAKFFRDIAAKANAVMFSSATYAKRPDVMDLYARTDMGLAVETPGALGALIARGGVPMQQIVAAMLSKAGQYIRRETSFKGIRYDVEPVAIDHEAYHTFSGSMRGIFDFDIALHDSDWWTRKLQEYAGQGAGVGISNAIGQAGADSTTFSSIMHNMVAQMLLSIKINAVADMAIDAIKAGKKPVVTVSQTMGQFVQDAAEADELKVGDALNIGFKDVIRRYLKRTLRITVTDHDGNKTYIQVSPDELPSDLRHQYDDALAVVESVNDTNMPLSPIDWVKFRIQQAGYNVGEITGRKFIMNYTGTGQATYGQRSEKEVSVASRRVTLDRFVNENGSREIHAMILNRAGSTGLSAHAYYKYKNQKPRLMIIAQAEGNIDDHMQLLGRINRNGQVVLLAYIQAYADIPAEARPAAVLAKKMASLNANTTASRRSAVSSDAVDFLNGYGDQVVMSILTEDPRLAVSVGLNIGPATPTDGVAAKFTGRLTLLPVAKQTEILDTITTRYNDYIAQLDALGENTLEAKTVDLQAKTVESDVLQEAKGPSPFQAAVNLETVQVKSEGRAFSPTELLTMLVEATGLKIPTQLTDLASQLQYLSDSAEADKSGMRTWTEQTNTYAKDEINTFKNPETRAEHRKRLEATYARWAALYNAVREGTIVGVTAGSNERTVGVVVKVERRQTSSKGGGNPTALGAWQVTIAIPDNSQRLIVPFTSLALESDAVAQDGSNKRQVLIGPASWTERWPQVVRIFETARKEGKDIRHIFTGNILSAYDLNNGTGHIINYTDENGAIRPGILMPRTFQKAKFLEKVAVRFQTAEQVILFVSANEGIHKAATGDGKVALTRSRYSGFEFEIDAGKATGGKYFLNPEVRRISGDGFVRVSGAMRFSTSSVDQATKLVKAINDLGGPWETNENQQGAKDAINAAPDKRRQGMLPQLGAPKVDPFKGSKISDRNGNLISVYHGGPEGIETFNPNRETFGARGVYFTKDRGLAELYAKSAKGRTGKTKVYEAHLNIRNPLVIRDKNFWQRLRDKVALKSKERIDDEAVEAFQKSGYIKPEDVAKLKAQGYDGIVNEVANEIVVFDADQIRLVPEAESFDDGRGAKTPDGKVNHFEKIERKTEAQQKVTKPFAEALRIAAASFGYKIVDTGLPFGAKDHWGKFHSFGTQLIDRLIPGDRLHQALDRMDVATPAVREYIKSHMSAPWFHRVWFGHDPLANLGMIIDKFGVKALPDWWFGLMKDSMSIAGIPLPGVQWLVQGGLVSDVMATNWLSLNVGEALSGGLSILGTYRLYKKAKNGKEIHHGWAIAGILFKTVGGILSSNPVLLISAATDTAILVHAKVNSIKAGLTKANSTQPKQGPLPQMGDLKRAPTFYSGVVRAVEGLKVTKAPAAQWLGPRQERTYTIKDKKTGKDRQVTEVSYSGLIGNTPGVKPEEIATMGLDDWLKEQTGPVTKEEVLDFVRANQLQVTEVLKGGQDSAVSPQHVEAAKRWATANLDDNDRQQVFESIDNAMRGYSSAVGDLEGLGMPEDLVQPFRERVGNAVGGPAKFGGPRTTTPGGSDYTEAVITLPPKGVLPSGWFTRDESGQWWVYDDKHVAQGGGKSEAAAIADAKKSKAWRKDDEFHSSHWEEPNVLFHTRWSTFIDKDGKKTLVLHEVQSDWHQKGRKQGYRHTVYVPQNMRSMNLGPKFTSKAAAEAYIAGLPENLRGSIEIQTYQEGDIPDAPFKTTWPELALKRMIRYAAEHGFDKIAWTPGEVQVERYDLSKLVDHIGYRKNPDGTYLVSLQQRGGRGRLLHEGKSTVANLEEALGKDITQKIVDGTGKLENWAPNNYPPKEYTVLRGLDLRVGGEKLRRFYDQMLVDYANKIGRKFGVKVGTTTIDARRRDAMGRLANLQEDGAKIQPVHSMDIPQAMRDSVMQGQPLFDKIRETWNLQKAVDKARIINRIQTLAENILGHRITVETVDTIMERDGTPLDWQGVYSPDERLVLIALNVALSPEGTFYHEAVHALRDLGVITPKEWVVLKKAVSDSLLADQKERYEDFYRKRLDLTEEQLADLVAEEAVADMLKAYMMDPKAETQSSSKIIAKILRFLEAVRNFAKGYGFRTATGIMDAIAAGKMKNRPGTAGPGRGYYVNERKGRLADLPEEPGADGKPQLVIPGAEQESQRTQAQRKADAPLKPKVAQKGVEGASLFGDEAKQGRLFQRAMPRRGAPAAAASFKPLHDQPMEAWADDTLRYWGVGQKIDQMIRAASLEAYTVLKDRHVAISRLVEAIETAIGKSLPDHMNPFLAARLFAGRMPEAVRKFEESRVKPLVEEMARRKVTPEELGPWLQARHVEERNQHLGQMFEPGDPFYEAMSDPAIVGASGWSQNEADAMLAKHSSRQADFEALADMVYQIQSEALDERLRNGLITQEAYDKITSTYQHYVPMQGFEADPENADFIPGIGLGFDLRAPEFKRALGRRSKADNPLAYVVSSAKKGIIRAEKARVDRSFLLAVQNYPNPDLYMVDKVEMKRVAVVDAKGNVSVEEVRDRGADQKDNVLVVKIGGKPRRITFTEGAGDRLARAMKNLEVPQMGSFVKFFHTLNRMWAQLNTSRDPQFLLKNFNIDSITALLNINAEGKAKTALKMAKRVGSAMRGMNRHLKGIHDTDMAKHAADYAANGGHIEYLGLVGVDAEKAMFKKLYDQQTVPGLKFDKALWDMTMGRIERWNNAIENAWRLSAYVALVENGVSKPRAAAAARELTVDFAVHGEWGPHINAFYAFFNASAEGQINLVKKLVYSKNVRRVLIGMMVMGFLQTLLNQWVAPPDDDDKDKYAKIPDYVKLNNFVFMAPEWIPDSLKPRSGYYTYPARGWNIFHIFGMLAAETVMGDRDPTNAAAVAGTALLDFANPLGHSSGTLLHSLWSTLAPTMLDPLVDIGMNENYQGSQIIPDYDKYDKRPDSEKFRKTTSKAFVEPAQRLNEMTGGSPERPGSIDVSPETLEHLYEFVTGGVGRLLSRSWNTAENLAAGIPLDPEKIPGARLYLGSDQSYADAEAYYKIKDDVEMTQRELKAQAGDSEGIKRIRREHGREVKLIGAVDAAEKQLAKWRKVKKAIEKAPGLDASAKRTRMTVIDGLMDKRMTLIRKLYNDAAGAPAP